MNGAYSELYLEDAMRNMGEMTEYAKDECGMSLDTLFHMFSVSGYAGRWEKGDPAVICGLSGTELCNRVMQKCGLAEDTGKTALIRFETEESYWAGHFIAYYQWKKQRPFQQMFSVLQEDDLLRLYPTMHTVSEEKGVEALDRVMEERTGISRLQMYRKQLGMTQQELAERSGVNLRTLQQYEVGRKELQKAAANNLFALAGALGCRAEALLDTING